MISMRCLIALIVLYLSLQTAAIAAPPTKGDGPGRVKPSGPGFEQSFELDGRNELERLCAEKVIKTLPLTSVPITALALHEITVHTEAGRYTVLLPLKAPQGEIRSLYWGADSIEETLTFMRLVEGGKITALKVEAYAEEFRQGVDTKSIGTDFHECPADKLKDILKPCKDCLVVEWVFGSLVD